MFLRNCWYMAAWDFELIDGKLLARTLLEDPVLLYKSDEGRIVALENRCCHRGVPLSMGRREGDAVRCMYHGLKFDPTGKCVQIPGQDRVPARLGVRSYPVVERDHIVWIWMGDPALADVDDIPDMHFLSDPRWVGIPDYLHYDANYLLIVDNLADFAHLAFVHTNTLGGSEEYAYTTKPVAVERLERAFRVERWHMDSDPPPFHVKVIRDKTAKVDRRNIGTMLVPGIFCLETTFTPAGSGAERGNVVDARQYRNYQFMTPETERTTHFFWSYMNDFEQGDHRISRSLHDSILEGFHEDKAFIEAQQKMLDQDPAFKMLAIAADGPLTHFRSVMDRLIAAEREMARPQAVTA